MHYIRARLRVVVRRLYRRRLLLLLLGLVVGDVEVPELVDAPVLVARDDPEPVPDVVLLEVLEVALGHLDLRGDHDAGLVLGDGDRVAQHAGLAVHLDAVLEELLEGADLHDLVVDRPGAIQDEGLRLLLLLVRSLWRHLSSKRHKTKSVGRRKREREKSLSSVARSGFTQAGESWPSEGDVGAG